MKKKSQASGTIIEKCGPSEIWFQLVRTHRAMDRRLSTILAPEGLTIPQTEILAMLMKKGPLPQQTLAEGLAVTKGNVAQVIDRLHRAGLLVRSEIADNRRANLLKITAKGLEKMHRISPHFFAFLHELFAPLPEARNRQLLEDLVTLERAAKDSI